MFKSSAPKLNDSMLHSVAGQQEMPLAAVSDCQQDAVRFFPEHRRRGQKVRPVHMLHQCAICTMMSYAHSGTVQSLSHRDVLQRPRASAFSHRYDK